MNGEGEFPHSQDTASVHLTLDSVTARVAAHPNTIGMVALGSAATGTMTVASDYDLLLVLHEALAPMSLILTRVDKRIAEIVLIAQHELERIVRDLPTREGGSGDASIARRFAEGRILCDHNDLLAQAQATVRQILPRLSVSESQRYAAWFSINYNLRMLTPMLAADDAIHRFAASYRMHEQINDLCRGYFTIRQLPWRGEKAAHRYLQQHDPRFLALLETFLAESRVEEKAKRYRELAAGALAPVGGLWEESAVVADAPVERVEEMLERWDMLLGPP